VIWTDFIQVGVLVASLGFTIPYLLMNIPGGWGTVSEVIKTPAFFDFAKPADPGAWAWIKNVFTAEYTILGGDHRQHLCHHEHAWYRPGRSATHVDRKEPEAERVCDHYVGHHRPADRVGFHPDRHLAEGLL